MPTQPLDRRASVHQQRVAGDAAAARWKSARPACRSSPAARSSGAPSAIRRRRPTAFKAAQAATGVAPVVSHESYLINLASLDPELLEKSRAAFREEIARCGMLGLPMVVIHWGSYKGGTLEEGSRGWRRA